MPNLSTVAAVVAIVVAVWHIWGLYAVSQKEKQILQLTDEIDNLEQTVFKKHRGYVSQPQLDALVEKEKKPLQNRRDKLILERQFILDKLPLVQFFKK